MEKCPTSKQAQIRLQDPGHSPALIFGRIPKNPKKQTCFFAKLTCRIGKNRDALSDSFVGETDLPDRMSPARINPTKTGSHLSYTCRCPYMEGIDHPNRFKQAGFPPKTVQIPAKNAKRTGFFRNCPENWPKQAGPVFGETANPGLVRARIRGTGQWVR